MKNTQPIITERLLDAPVEKVWKAITDKDEMQKWYFDIAAFRPEVGFKFQFSGQGKNGEEYIHLCEITEVVPLKKLSYSWKYDGHEGISYVTFDLSKEGDKTRLTLTHSGLETFPSNNESFAVESFMAGWNYIIGTSLPDYLSK